VAVESARQAALPYADEEDDDAAERFADAARASQAERTVNQLSEPTPDADTYITDEAATDAPALREAGARRGSRGGRGGRGNAVRKDAARAALPEPVVEAPAPAAAPEPAPAEAPAPAAAKTPRARKTAATKTAAAKKPAAKKAAARPARKTKAASEQA
jgi:hypothetical protein